PLPDVAGELVDAVGGRAGAELADRDGLADAGGPEVGLPLAEQLSPGVAAAGPAAVPLGPAGRLLPLGGRGGPRARPRGVGDRLVPADADDRVVPLARGVRPVAPVARAGAAGAVGEPHHTRPDLARPGLQVVVAAGADEAGELLVGDGAAVEVEGVDPG